MKTYFDYRASSFTAVVVVTIFVVILSRSLIDAASVAVVVAAPNKSSPLHDNAHLSLPPNTTSATTNAKRQHYLRGERTSAVIAERLPDMKAEVCKAERIQQTIRVRGCQQRTVVNRYCYGQCNSFFIPRPATATATRRRRQGHRRHTAGAPPRKRRRARTLTWAPFRSCSYCRPKTVEWVTVGLSCPRRRPSYRRRRVQVVKECACGALALD